jgi:hypothetical protein
MTNGLQIALADTQCTEGYVVTAAGDAFPLGSGVRAVPLPTFLRDVIMPLTRRRG